LLKEKSSKLTQLEQLLLENSDLEITSLDGALALYASMYLDTRSETPSSFPEVETRLLSLSEQALASFAALKTGHQQWKGIVLRILKGVKDASQEQQKSMIVRLYQSVTEVLGVSQVHVFADVMDELVTFYQLAGERMVQDVEK